jgi:hypothetical protein
LVLKRSLISGEAEIPWFVVDDSESPINQDLIVKLDGGAGGSGAGSSLLLHPQVTSISNRTKPLFITSENKCVDRMGKRHCFSPLPLHPKVVLHILVALVHNDHHNPSILVHESCCQ